MVVVELAMADVSKSSFFLYFKNQKLLGAFSISGQLTNTAS
jgi:hypothetical protein